MPTVLRIAFILLLAAGLAVAGPVVAAAAGEDTGDDKKEEPRTYTNDDLGEGAAGSKDRTAAPEGDDGPADPLKAMKDAEERRAWHRKQMDETRKEIAALERQIEYWEARRLSIRNPLLPRRVVPEDGGDETPEDPLEGLDSAAKLDRIDEIMADLQTRLDRARDRLRQLETDPGKPPQREPVPGSEPAPGKHLLPEPTS
jgi:hypothetical protein